MADDPSEEEIENRITAWIERSAAALRSAGDDRAAILAVLERFLDEGLAIVYSPSAMWEYASMAMRRAGFDASQEDRGLRIYSTVTNRRFQGGRPYPPDWPWHEAEDAEPGTASARPRE